MENVPGLLSHDEGRTLQTIFSALIELGYHLEWCVDNSKYFGVPQQRKRLYIVAYLEPFCAGKIFPLEASNAENLKELIPGPQGQRVYDTSGIACTQCASAGGWGGKTGLYFIDMNTDPVITDVARCITARQDSGVSNHRGEHSAVLIEDEPPRAVITPDRETVRQQGIYRLFSAQDINITFYSLLGNAELIGKISDGIFSAHTQFFPYLSSSLERLQAMYISFQNYFKI